MTDRLFLDANVLFSAAYREESGLLRLWRIDAALLLTSPYAIEEARRNLDDDAQRGRLSKLIRSVERVEAMSSRSITVKLPPKDEPIFKAALGGEASHLITGDFKHFGPLFGTKVMGIWVMPPAEYLKAHPK